MVLKRVFEDEKSACGDVLGISLGLATQSAGHIPEARGFMFRQYMSVVDGSMASVPFEELAEVVADERATPESWR